MSLIYITGGVRSGKSGFAEELAKARGESVLYVATGTAWDEEMIHRIELHRKRRPDSWGLVEVTAHLSEIFCKSESYQTILIDCLSTWVSNRLIQVPKQSLLDPEITRSLLTETEEWLQLVRRDAGRTYLIVSSEVGMGGVALSPLGRWFADVLGEINQKIAHQADEAYVIVSGIPWRIKG